MSGLDRGYRLLLRAYPKGRRRAELLDTLLESAQAGRHRPTLREAGNLLRHGMRARLGRAGSHGVVVVATLVALVAGFFGASVAARLAWELAPGFPAGPALTEITGAVYPTERPAVERTGSGLFYDPIRPSTTQVLLYGHDEDFEFTTLSITPADRFVAGDYRAWTTAVQTRLVATGWQVTDPEVTGPTSLDTGQIDDTGRTLTATRGGYALRIDTTTDVVDTPAGSFDATASLDRLTPWYVQALTILGLLTGALIGWLVTGWAGRRTEHASVTARVLTGKSAVTALVLLVPQAILGHLLLTDQLLTDGPPGVPFWTFSVTYFFGLAGIGLGGFAVALVVAAVAGRRERLVGAA